MSTSKSPPAGQQPASQPDRGGIDLPRQQMAAGARLACVLFGGAEAMRKVQQKAAHDALQHHAALARRLQDPCSPGDLLALQADLFRFDVQGASLYWQQLGALALETQRQLLATWAHRASDEAEAGQSPLGAPMPFFNFNGINTLLRSGAEASH